MTTQEIWHGDSRKLAIPDGVNCFIEDPPYGVDFVSRRAATPGGKKFVRSIAGDADLETALREFQEVQDAILPHAAAECDLYVFTRWDIVDVWMDAVRQLDRHGFAYKMLLVWDKGYPGMGDIDANWGCGHELILYCKKGRRDVAYRRSGIIAVDKLPSQKHIHPTEKPAKLMEKLIEMSTTVGDLVVDPYSGSGATAVAAQRLNRNAIGIEADEAYIQDSRSRIAGSLLV